MKDFFELLLRFIEGFNSKRAVFLTALLLLLLGCFVVYDRYTASFTFGRLDHAADLITKLQTIEANPAKRTPELEAAYQSLRAQVAEAIASKPATVVLSNFLESGPSSRVAKFAAGGILWLLGAISMIPKMFRGDKSGLGGFALLGLAAILFGLVGLSLPNFWWPWGNLIFYPIFGPFIALALLAVFGIVMERRKSLGVGMGASPGKETDV